MVKFVPAVARLVCPNLLGSFLTMFCKPFFRALYKDHRPGFLLKIEALSQAHCNGLSPSAFVLAPSSPTAHEICTYAAFQDGKKFHMKQKPASTDLDITRIPWRGWLAHREMHPFARKAISRLKFGNLHFFLGVPDQIADVKRLKYHTGLG